MFAYTVTENNNRNAVYDDTSKFIFHAYKIFVFNDLNYIKNKGGRKTVFKSEEDIELKECIVKLAEPD